MITLFWLLVAKEFKIFKAALSLKTELMTVIPFDNIGLIEHLFPQ